MSLILSACRDPAVFLTTNSYETTGHREIFHREFPKKTRFFATRSAGSLLSTVSGNDILPGQSVLNTRFTFGLKTGFLFACDVIVASALNFVNAFVTQNGRVTRSFFETAFKTFRLSEAAKL